jgi:plastocyanin
VRRIFAIAWAVAVGAAVAPAAWSAGDAPAPPTAVLRVAPAAVTAGDGVTLDGSGSTDPDGAVVSYAWDLDGDGSFERLGGSDPRLTETLSTPGTVRIGLRVVDDSGLPAEAHETVTVAEPAPPAAAPAAAPAEEIAQPAADPRAEAAEEPSDAEPGEAAAEPARETASASRPAGRETASASRPAARERRSAELRAAASTTVSIKDFSFAPKSVTVNVGDTVTFSNQGPTNHTATANGGSFDTGDLDRGQSGSVTFRNAGTFAYHCEPHPFMTGTVRVVAASSGGGGGSGGGSSGGGSSGGGGDVSGASAGSTSSSGSSLPDTGLPLGGMLLAGLTLLAAGVALRRAAAPRPG